MQTICAPGCPPAIGPYSHAVKAAGFVFCAGQIGLNKDGELISEDISSQTKQVLQNLKNVLEAAGTSLDKVVKTTIFLSDLSHFILVNELYGQYFPHKPARSTVQVAKLPKGALIEIECIALD